MQAILKKQAVSLSLARPLYELAALAAGESYCLADTTTSDECKGHPEILQLWSEGEICATVDFGIHEVYLVGSNKRVPFSDVLGFTTPHLQA